MQHILIESIEDSSLKLTSSDLDVTLYCQAEARVTEPGKVFLPLAKLLAITKTLLKPPISISDQTTTAAPASPLSAPRSNFAARTHVMVHNPKSRPHGSRLAAFTSQGLDLIDFPSEHTTTLLAWASIPDRIL